MIAAAAVTVTVLTAMTTISRKSGENATRSQKRPRRRRARSKRYGALVIVRLQILPRFGSVLGEHMPVKYARKTEETPLV